MRREGTQEQELQGAPRPVAAPLASAPRALSAAATQAACATRAARTDTRAGQGARGLARLQLHSELGFNLVN